MRASSILSPLVAACAIAPGCTCTELPPPPAPERAIPTPAIAAPPALAPIGAPFVDEFDRAAIGDDWYATAPNAYRIVNGELVVARAYNHPLWLRRPIPRDATIEFDCWSNDDAGDLKVEAWGDGRSYAREASYTSTSYNFVFGGWHNQISTLARMNEHGADRQTRSEPKVVKGRKYHWLIERKDRHIEWRIDGQPFLSIDDPEALDGDGHRFFAINDWEAELHFDHLKITPTAAP